MIRFRFGLTPLAEVEPWGAGRELHWFGLTDGWYGIDAGGHELLRYLRANRSGTARRA
ncbi:DUF5984 family protein [Streptomyces sp. NPDC087270]|uniref:DUF5984 family protein n=1 Tax=Streptomyces sp. NPDC087270 TaxID=3365774 RepID=UPI00383069BA